MGAPAQYNWLTGAYEAPAVQLRLEIQWVPESGEWQAEALEGVLLLATETGTQLLVSGRGLSLGKHSERLTIKRHRRLCGEIPLFRLQEVVVMGRGISVSSDLIEEACARVPAGAVAMINPAFGWGDGRSGLGFLLEYRRDQLPAFYQWQNLQEGNYVVGLEPATAHAGSRAERRQRGEIGRASCRERV